MKGSHKLNSLWVRCQKSGWYVTKHSVRTFSIYQSTLSWSNLIFPVLDILVLRRGGYAPTSWSGDSFQLLHFLNLDVLTTWNSSTLSEGCGILYEQIKNLILGFGVTWSQSHVTDWALDSIYTFLSWSRKKEGRSDVIEMVPKPTLI